MMALDLGGNWGNEFARLSTAQTLTTSQLRQLFKRDPGEAPVTNVDFHKLYVGLGVYNTTSINAAKTGAANAHKIWTKGLNDQYFSAVTDASSTDWASGLSTVGGKGSNNWVVSGSRSANSKPLLANDPHLGLSAPAIWYSYHSPCKIWLWPTQQAARRSRRKTSCHWETEKTIFWAFPRHLAGTPDTQNTQTDPTAIRVKGFLATDNQRIRSPGYPLFVSLDWTTPNWFDRIDQLPAARSLRDMASMQYIQTDQLSLATQILLRYLQYTAAGQIFRRAHAHLRRRLHRQRRPILG